MTRSTSRAAPCGSRKRYCSPTTQPAQPLGARGGGGVELDFKGTRNPEPCGALLLGRGVVPANPAERAGHPPSEVALVPRAGPNCWGLEKWEGGLGETWRRDPRRIVWPADGGEVRP